MTSRPMAVVDSISNKKHPINSIPTRVSLSSHRSYINIPSMAPDKKDEASSPDAAIPDPPPIHPSFIQVAKPYIFEQTIQRCIAAMGVNPLREESLRLQGVTWIDNVRRVLYL